MSRLLRASLWIGLLVATPAAAGLFGGNDAPGRIPVPSREFTAVIEDVGGVRTPVSRFSFDGEVYLFGELGKAQVTVPFEEIREVGFEAVGDEDWRDAVVLTRAGEQVRVRVDADRPLFGRTSFGNYRIEVADVRRVELP